MRPGNAVTGFAPFSIARLTGDAFAAGRNAGHFDPAAFPLAARAGEKCDHAHTRLVNTAVIAAIGQVREDARRTAWPLPSEQVALSCHVWLLCLGKVGGGLPVGQRTPATAGVSSRCGVGFFSPSS
ncbi:hypothetical protein predicted by Glimmer/Critica (plasmid) [Acetobacter ghanensis]|uniref:Uncharacterized protein n=1 Tax=Acetobacter ghanensis TaxID=431306 RepID=A0A0U5BMQ1_9PROT|nr:hypothetical protein predicted by Glimmer/Critica [Acetobacter ghanensis]